MGFLWDLIQHNQIREQRDNTESLARRVRYLEEDLRATQQLLQTLIKRLETHFGEDIDRDGRIG
jgi:hypothetical protein